MVKFKDVSRINGKTIVLVLLCFTLVFGLATATFDVGKVKAAETKIITTAEDLHNIRHDAAGNYVLGNDISLDIAPYNTGGGWEPIEEFKGTFDGKGYTISGLMINKDRNRAGLFGSVHSGATLSNVNLVDVDVKAGHNIGALAGDIGSGGLIENVTVTGNISGADAVGGVVGFLSNAKIKNSHANVNVKSESRAGGLISTGGGDDAIIENSTSRGTVSSTGRGVGGLAGEASVVIKSSSSATVTSTHNGKATDIGGLVGRNTPFRGEITDSFATGDVHAINGDNVGGLIGGTGANTTSPTTNSYATGTVTGKTNVGGLIGVNNGMSITSSYATGEVYGVDSVGGLLGYHFHNNAIVQKSYATGKVIATGDNVGGLIGETKDASRVIDTYARGNVAGNENVGGLIGFNPNSTVERSYATGEVTGVGQVGGLIGQNIFGKYSPNAPNYYDSQTTGQSDSKGGTGLLTAVLTDVANKESTYKNWNFKGVWDMEPNDYPIFALFADINELPWAKDKITEATEKGYISGYPDGTFKPRNPITRAEFAVIISRALDLDGTGDAPMFTDQNNIPAWAKEAIDDVYRAGIVVGDADGTFRPNDKIRRTEIAVMTAKAFDLKRKSTGSTGFSDDQRIPAWAKEYVAALKDNEVIQGKGGNNFAPLDDTIRAEGAIILLKALE